MTCDTVVTLTAASMRDREAIRLRAPTAAVRRSIHEHGIEPSSRHVDELLDERLAHCGWLATPMPDRGFTAAKRFRIMAG